MPVYDSQCKKCNLIRNKQLKVTKISDFIFAELLLHYIHTRDVSMYVHIFKNK